MPTDNCCINVDYFNQNITYPILNTSVPQTVESTMTLLSGWDTTTRTVTLSTATVRTSVIETPAANFIWNSPLSGWNYDTNEYDEHSRGARPFWGKAYDDASQATKFKGVDVAGGGLRLVNEYTFISQPPPSNIVINTNGAVTYHRRDSEPFTWAQKIRYNTHVAVNSWNKLIIDNTAVSTLSATLNNNLLELVVEETQTPSDLVLSIDSGSPLLLNYYAVSGFRWQQPVTNTSLGVPPTGGVWIPAVSGELIEPTAPHKHLTNRHFPTVAAVPYPSQFYTVDDVGGYMLPKNLGVSTFVSKARNSKLTTNYITPIGQDRGLTRVFQDPNSFDANYGFTNADQNQVIITKQTDSRWMKGAITEWSKAGTIITSQDHQEFVPYQTEYEAYKHNSKGLRRQGDDYDPWHGETNSTWKDSERWPPNYKGQYPIQQWYEQFDVGDNQVFIWKTDIFNNEYFLLKDTESKTIYEKRQDVGDIWVRNSGGVIASGDKALKDTLDKFLYTSIDAGVLSLDVWFDTLFIESPTSLGISKILFDYDTGEISGTADLSKEIPLCGRWFAGTWLHEAEKRVTIAVLASADNSGTTYFYPELYFLDLNSMELARVSFNADAKVATAFTASLTAIERPILTYSTSRQVYNISFTGTADIQGMYFSTIDVSKRGNQYSVSQAACISPVA